MDNKPAGMKAKDPSISPLIRSLVLELAVYTPLVVFYLLVVLRFLNDHLTWLYNENLVAYAFLATALILGQGILLEMLTSWLIRQFGLRH
jgi:hypothetical protein